MSSLQKFHRRTNLGVKPTWPPMVIGDGDDLHGYWLGTAGNGTSKLIVAPLISDMTGAIDPYGYAMPVAVRDNNTDGLANTNAINAGKPYNPSSVTTAARSYSLGGYNDWYIPARAELTTIWQNRNATPFANSNGFTNNMYWTSTGVSSGSYAGKAWGRYMTQNREYRFYTYYQYGHARFARSANI